MERFAKIVNDLDVRLGSKYASNTRSSRYWHLNYVLWFSLLEHEEVAARKLIAALFENMASIGCIILTGLDVSRKSNNKSLLLFKRTNPDSAAFFSLSLGGTDKIRLVNAPRDITEVIYDHLRIKILIRILR